MDLFERYILDSDGLVEDSVRFELATTGEQEQVAALLSLSGLRHEIRTRGFVQLPGIPTEGELPLPFAP